MARALATVKFVDDNGDMWKVGAKELLGGKPAAGDVVVVRGTARRDDGGNLVVLASGIYVRPGDKKDRP